MYLGKVLTVLIISCMAQFDSICLKNNQVKADQAKADQAQEDQTQKDQAQRDQALKELPKYFPKVARKMIMNDQENRTPKPRCPSNYKLLLKLPWKNRCSYKGVRLWFCNNPCNLAVFEILPLQRDQIERDQALGDQTNGDQAPVQGDQVQEDLALKELLTDFLKVAMKKVMTNQKTMTAPKPRYSSNGGIFDRVMRFGSVWKKYDK